MKKSALFLSALVTISSVTPVVAMQPNQQQSSAKAQAMLNLFRIDLLNTAMRRVGRAVSAASDWMANINILTGDKTEQNNESAQATFNGVAQGFRQGLRDANIPGTEKIVNDNSMRFIKMLLIGGGLYTIFRFALNIFPIQQAQQNNRRQARSRFATHVPGTGRGRRR